MTARCLVNLLISLVIFVMSLQAGNYKSSFFFFGFFFHSAVQQLMGGSVFNAAYLRKIEMLFKLCSVWQ